MAGFDECCPHCGKKMEDIQSAWSNRDNDMQFRMPCEHCEKEVEVTVHVVPEFSTGKPRCERCSALCASGQTYCTKCMSYLLSIKA